MGISKLELLRELSFGQRVAEEETDVLSTYFVETDQWGRLYKGEINIVYGPKGSGKSALYSLLISRSSELFDRSILLVAAENPRGATAFRDLLADPPTSEREFIGLWKLYFAALLHSVLSEFDIRNAAFKELDAALRAEGLVKGSNSLGALLGRVIAYAKRLARPEAIEGGVAVDPTTQVPVGFTGKITFSEPAQAAEAQAMRSVDHLLQLADKAFAADKLLGWILLDRLDVAFTDSAELEANALRALFRVYLDLLSLNAIKLKIFLRTDIWERITEQGFREGSHLIRDVTISWNRNSLLNLVVRRLISNERLREAYNVQEGLARSSVQEQEAFIYRVLPDQIDIGPNKPKAFEWLLSRTRDGTQENAPRELIHFLNALREVQVRQLEIGEAEPDGEMLFSRSSFKLALPIVSKGRLQQTIYAEYPETKDWLEKLRGEKTLHNVATLSQVWNIPGDEAAQRASYLAKIGFFELRGSKGAQEYWVPFLYRDGLDLVQGAAD